MNTGTLITAGLFVLIGLITAIHPLFAFNLRAWFARHALDMKVEPGARTLIAYRVVGIAFVVIGAAMFFAQMS